MALDKTIATPIGVPARYHRIIGQEVSYLREPEVPGCKGSVYVRIASFASKDARDSNADPLANLTVRIRFGAEVEGEIKGVPILAIQSDEPTRAQIYEALVRTPAFEGAIEA